MTTMYIYSNETQEHLATITGDTNEACERYAQDLGYDPDAYGWTYSPAFGASDGLVYNADARIIDAAN